MLESAFQADLIEELSDMFPGCYILHTDTGDIQGFPDLTILNTNQRWATLECKKSMSAPYQPNQKYYIDDLNRKGFSAMICPENKTEVLHELFRALEPRRKARFSLSE